MPVIVAGGLLTSGLEGLGIGLLAPLLAGLNGTDPAGAPAPVSRALLAANVFGEQNRLYTLIAAIISVMILKAAVQGGSASFAAWIDTKIGHDLRSALSKRLLTIDYPFFLDHDPGRLVTIIATDSWRVTDAIRLSFSTLGASTALLVFAALMGVISPPLLAGVVLGSTLIRLLQLKLVRHLHALGERLTETNAELANRMLRSIEAIRLIRIFGQERREHQSFCAASDAVRQVLLETERSTALVVPALEVAQTALFTAVLAGAAALGIGLPVLLAFLLLLYRAEPHLRSLSQTRLAFASLTNSIREVEWLLSIHAQPPMVARPDLATFAEPIRFENVTFAYPNRPEQPPALNDVSFVLREGVSTALIGHSGSGKSTVIHLLCRLFAPIAGTIRLGEIDLADIDVGVWRQAISVAGQDLDLIAGSLADNISYGFPEASRAEIERAAELADAAGFIQSLPNGYDTAVGTRGLSLSGGQRQRIGIARAIVRKPRLLILDEATNAVDGMSETAIMALLKKHLGNVTTLMISHHPATLAACADAILMQSGRVVRMGPASSSWAREQVSSEAAVPQIPARSTA